MRKSAVLGLAGLLAAVGSVSGALAACPDDETVARLAADMVAARPAEAPEVATLEDGLCAQEKLVEALTKEWGPPAGYKAGLTSEAAQKMFGVSEPVRGVLFGDGLVDSGAAVPAEYGAVPRFEADMIAVVADEGINDAQTPLDVLAHLSALRPFIELPDLVVADPRGLTGPSLTAINVGARQGVLGAPIEIVATQGFVDDLAAMTVRVTDVDGKELASAPGRAVLGQPLNAVLWLRKAGVTFRAGDLISLGSFGPLLKPEPGLTATVTYEGLPGDPWVRVSFE